MPAFTARIPQRWANTPHPYLRTANPKQFLLVIASTKKRAERTLNKHAGPIQGMYWEALENAGYGALNTLLREPGVKGISHVLVAEHAPINLNL